MRRAVALVALLLVVSSAGIAGAAERFVRGVHDGRAYRLYVPAALAAERPLVVALHGCAQTPEDFALGTRLNRAAGRRGVAVLYPQQGAFANPARCWNWFVPGSPTRGEVGELLAMVREVPRTYGATAARVVVIGFSAGGYMAVNLACAAPDLVVGVGVMAGGPYGCADSAGRAIACMRGENLDGAAAAARCATTAGRSSVRASLWHGDGDSVVNPANLGALTTMFTRLTGAAGEPARAVDDATRTTYRVREATVVETWLVHGMGHAWSGGDPRGTHTFPSGPDATEAMLRFLVDS